MRMLLVMLAACGSSKAPEPQPGSGSAPTPIAGSGAGSSTPCLPRGTWHSLQDVTVDDRQIIACAADRICTTKKPVCVAIAIATGARTAVAPPARPPPAPPGYQVERVDTTLTLCKPAEPSENARCVQLPFAATETAMVEHGFSVAISPDGTLAAIAGEMLGAMYLVDAATGKQRARVLGEPRDGNCLVQPYFLGDVIYARACSHSFPLHTHYLFATTGKRIGVLQGVDIPPGDRPVRVAGTRWAVHLEEGDGYLVFDAKTGERVRMVPDKPAHLPHDHDEEVVRRGPLATPGGKLVVLGEAITVSDPATGTIEQTWPAPFCAPDDTKPVCP